MKQSRDINHSPVEGSESRFTFLMVDIVQSVVLYHLIGSARIYDVLTSFQDMVNKTAEKIDGKVRKWYGDSCMIGFLTPEDGMVCNAVECAFAIIDRASQFRRVENLPTSFGVRIGLHIGKVTFSKKIYRPLGPLPLVASQLGNQSYPNSVTISDAVYQSLSTDLRSLFRHNGFLGEIAIYTSEKPPRVKPVPRGSWQKAAMFEQLCQDILLRLGYTVLSHVTGPDGASDLVAYGKLPGLRKRFEILVECKAMRRKVNVADVRIFQTKVQDYGANFARA